MNSKLHCSAGWGRGGEGSLPSSLPSLPALPGPGSWAEGSVRLDWVGGLGPPRAQGAEASCFPLSLSLGLSPGSWGRERVPEAGRALADGGQGPVGLSRVGRPGGGRRGEPLGGLGSGFQSSTRVTVAISTQPGACSSQCHAQGFRARSQRPLLWSRWAQRCPSGTGWHRLPCALSLAPAPRTAGELCSRRSVGLAPTGPWAPGSGLHGDSCSQWAARAWRPRRSPGGRCRQLPEAPLPTCPRQDTWT